MAKGIDIEIDRVYTNSKEIREEGNGGEEMQEVRLPRVAVEIW